MFFRATQCTVGSKSFFSALRVKILYFRLVRTLTCGGAGGDGGGGGAVPLGHSLQPVGIRYIRKTPTNRISLLGRVAEIQLFRWTRRSWYLRTKLDTWGIYLLHQRLLSSRKIWCKCYNDPNSNFSHEWSRVIFWSGCRNENLDLKLGESESAAAISCSYNSLRFKFKF